MLTHLSGMVLRVCPMMGCFSPCESGNLPEKGFVFVVCENKKYLWVAELFPVQSAGTSQTPDRLLAARLARDWSNSWMMEGREREKSQTIEQMQY